LETEAMATKLPATALIRDGRNKYPWEEWLDGGVWQITPGEDFTCSIEHFRRQCYMKAAQRGGNARTSMENGHILLQFAKGGA
jgi:hypothetical protein